MYSVDGVGGGAALIRTPLPVPVHPCPCLHTLAHVYAPLPTLTHSHPRPFLCTHVRATHPCLCLHSLTCACAPSHMPVHPHQYQRTCTQAYLTSDDRLQPRKEAAVGGGVNAVLIRRFDKLDVQNELIITLLRDRES